MPLIERKPPVSEQVHRLLRERILKQEYAPGQRLPSEEQLAVEMGVSRATLRTALAALATSCASPSPLQPTPPDTAALSPSPSPSPAPSATHTALPPTHTAAPTLTATITDTPTPAASPTATPLPDRIVDEFGVPMVRVPAGQFLMGTEVRARNERPEHTVTLDDYYIDQFEVTFASFAEFLNAKGNQFEGNANWVEANDPDLRIHEVDGVWQVDAGSENYPMVEMTWYGARAYCEWRGGRLPSEAEWEKAARGPDGRTFPWGEEISCEQANYAGCTYAAMPVDSLPAGASPYGAYHMAGNVMEWVSDWYDIEYYANSPAENPTGPETGDFRLLRGGTWLHAAGNVRTTYRFPKLPVLTYVTVGFRCARNAFP